MGRGSSTSTTATALYENLLAAFEKDASAVSAGVVLANSYVTAAMIASSAVTVNKIGAAAVSQAKLKTSQGEISSFDSDTTTTLPGGEYGFYTRVKASAAGGADYYLARPTSTSYVTQVRILGAGTGRTYYAQQRYIQASPPYDLGDGEVPLFVFARVDGGGKIISTYVAQDPPWANNGPTNIAPDGVDEDGRPVKFVRKLEPAVVNMLKSLAGPAPAAATKPAAKPAQPGR